MRCDDEPCCSLPSWSRPVLRSPVILAAVALLVAGCSSETTRFAENPFAARSAPAAGEVTGSVQRVPAQRVQAQPLPPPGAARMSAPATQPASASPAPQRTASYQPMPPQPTPQAAPVPPNPVASGPSDRSGWTWEGGTPITLRSGETVAMLAERYGVPAAAIVQANNLPNAQSVRPGQRLVIPSRGDAAIITGSAPPPQRPSAPPQPAPAISAPQTTSAAPAPSSRHVHTVVAGDTLMRLTRRYGRSLSEIARANNLQADAQLQIGDRIVIPGMQGDQRTASAQPQAARQQTPTPPARAEQQAPSSVVQQNWPQESPGQSPGQSPGREEQVASARNATPVNHTPQAEQPRAQSSAQSAARGFRWPVRGRVIAGFGPRPNGQRNDGINVAVPQGTPIRAAEDGVVAYAGNELKSYGNLVLIRHENGYVTAYAHASEIMVKRDEQVRRGQVIGRAGQTGNVDAPQLHFEVRKGSSPVDPMPFLEQGGST